MVALSTKVKRFLASKKRPDEPQGFIKLRDRGGEEKASDSFPRTFFKQPPQGGWRIGITARSRNSGHLTPPWISLFSMMTPLMPTWPIGGHSTLFTLFISRPGSLKSKPIFSGTRLFTTEVGTTWTSIRG